MRWAKPGKNRLLTHQTAYRIYQDILLSLEAYYDDSFVAKFFYPEEISDHCKPVAASFALVLSSPKATLNQIYNSKLYYLYYLTMMYGAQIYIKERALKTHHAYFSLQKDAMKIEKIKNEVTEMLLGDYVIDPAANMVMDMYKTQLIKTKEKVQKQTKNTEFNDEDFDRCLNASLVFGYLFGREMVIEK